VRSIPNSPILSTDFGYTGQRKLDSGMGGIMDYKARFYSPYINRFLQPDTLFDTRVDFKSRDGRVERDRLLICVAPSSAHVLR